MFKTPFHISSILNQLRLIWRNPPPPSKLNFWFQYQRVGYGTKIRSARKKVTLFWLVSSILFFRFRLLSKSFSFGNNCIRRISYFQISFIAFNNCWRTEKIPQVLVTYFYSIYIISTTIILNFGRSDNTLSKYPVDQFFGSSKK